MLEVKHKLLIVLASLLSLAILLPACGLFSGSDSERKEIISFTRQVLEIEGKRDALVNCYAPLRMKVGIPGMQWAMRQTFLTGVPPNAYAHLDIEVPPTGLEGMTSLLQRLVMLHPPLELQSIKASLVDIYLNEVEIGTPYIAFDSSAYNHVAVSVDNLDTWQHNPSYYHNIINSEWFKVQSFRRIVYVQWAEILREHGIDLGEEGFTELVGR